MLKIVQSDFFSLMTIAKIIPILSCFEKYPKCSKKKGCGPWKASLGLFLSRMSLPEEECS
jgi:hypothetical protein